MYYFNKLFILFPLFISKRGYRKAGLLPIGPPLPPKLFEITVGLI